MVKHYWKIIRAVPNFASTLENLKSIGTWGTDALQWLLCHSTVGKNETP